MMQKIMLLIVVLLGMVHMVDGQVRWTNVDSAYQPLPAGVHVYYTNDSLDGKPNIAYYITAPLQNKQLRFSVDTTLHRRLTPTAYYEKNQQPLVVVNCTFFEFEQSRNLSTVIQKGKMIGYNKNTLPGRGKDTFTYRHFMGSALGISKHRKADIAWLYADSTTKKVMAFQQPVGVVKDSLPKMNKSILQQMTKEKPHVWRMQTAIGGGPVLLQNGMLAITNNQEMKFTGKAGLAEKHPRTCIGYTKDDQLIIMVIQGRFPNIAEGASLPQEASLLQSVGCVEAMNLDGGGSSCLLINGKQTIVPSDKQGQQRPVPCVFMIQAQ